MKDRRNRRLEREEASRKKNNTILALYATILVIMIKGPFHYDDIIISEYIYLITFQVKSL